MEPIVFPYFKLMLARQTVSPLPGKEAKEEVMVQGNHVNAVVELLIKRGVGKKWIEVVEGSTKKKK